MSHFISIFAYFLATIVLASVFCSHAAASDRNFALGATVRASSFNDTYVPANAVDQKVTDASRWIAEAGDKNAWIEIAFQEPVDVRMVDVHSGWKDEKKSILKGFDLSLKIDGEWILSEEGKVRGNDNSALRIYPDGDQVTELRLRVLGNSLGRIREIAVYDNRATIGIPGYKGASKAQVVDRSIHQIAVNQVGYRTAFSKRFTAPLTADGVAFSILKEGDVEPVYRGTVSSGIGDFSAFRPEDSDTHYRVEIDGGVLWRNISDPFLIQSDLYLKQFWQPAVDFLIDSRSVVGTHPSAYGGCPWRDGTYYDAIVPSLVLFYLANAEVIDAMPKQIDWQAEKARVTASDFKFDAKNPCSGGVMDAVHRYYDLEPPQADAPDVVKLIHWGAGYYLVNPVTRDPSRDPLLQQIHPQTLEQISYMLWAWPVLKKWLPQSFYDQCLALCLENWDGSLEISELWQPSTYADIYANKSANPSAGAVHPYKGRHAPGHSIVPNLLMYEIAQRDGLADPDKYLSAAVEQAAWIIENLDWNEPRTTKGHRMSEHRTIPNLVWLLQKYPEHAPAGLKEKIYDWARVAVARSDNMWDFRRYDLKKEWTIPKFNDVGNSLSLPAIVTAASWVIEDAELRARLVELGTASIDHVFGRNPRLAASPSRPEMGFPEVDRGWPISYRRNVCARLELCRGSISTLPGTEMYPFNPEGSYRHAEGWVNYGASWCISLSYLQYDAMQTTPVMPK